MFVPLPYIHVTELYCIVCVFYAALLSLSQLP